MREEMESKEVPQWRWIVTSVGIAIFAWLTGMAALVGVILTGGPELEWFGVIIGGAWTSAVVGLVLGSWPGEWRRAAFITWILMMMIGVSMTLDEPSLGRVVLSGVFCGGVLVLGIHAKCTGLTSWRWGALMAIVLFLFHVGKIWDFPAIPDDYGNGTGEFGIESSYRYELGGLGKRDLLWRLDGSTEEILNHLKDRFEAEPVSELPEGFFQMRPYYWPKEAPISGLNFVSPDFHKRGNFGLGEHCLALVDPEAKRVYVWMKREK